MIYRNNIKSTSTQVPSTQVDRVTRNLSLSSLETSLPIVNPPTTPDTGSGGSTNLVGWLDLVHVSGDTYRFPGTVDFTKPIWINYRQASISDGSYTIDQANNQITFLFTPTRPPTVVFHQAS